MEVANAAVAECDDGMGKYWQALSRLRLSAVDARPNFGRCPLSVLNFSSMASIPQSASAAVLKPSEPVPEEAVAVQGPNFDERPTLDSLLGSYERIGFQANSLGKAINIVNKMVRLAHSPT